MIKIDKALDVIRSTKGIYAQPIAKWLRKAAYKPRLDVYEVTIELPAGQIGGGQCVTAITDPHKNPKVVMAPVIAFIDLTEFDSQLPEPPLLDADRWEAFDNTIRLGDMDSDRPCNELNRADLLNMLKELDK